MSHPTNYGTEQPFQLAHLVTPTATRRRRRWPIVLVATAAAVAVLAGALLAVRGIWPDAPLVGSRTFTVHAELVISDRDGYSTVSGGDRDACHGDGGYSDLRGGAQVTVTDPAGAVVAVGSLATGQSDYYSCRFAITVSGVPRGKGIYGIHVGNQFRGAVQYREADLTSRTVQLTIRS